MRQDTYEAFDNITVRHADGSETRAEAEHPQGDDANSIERAGKEPELATKVNKAGIEIEARTGQFVSGHKGGPGRPKGSRNKVAQDFFDDLHEAWNKGREDGKSQGLATIEAAMQSKPADVVKAMVALMPKELDVTMRDATDDEIQRRLNSLLDSIGLRVPTAASNITEIEAEPTKPEDQDPL